MADPVGEQNLNALPVLIHHAKRVSILIDRHGSFSENGALGPHNMTPFFELRAPCTRNQSKATGPVVRLVHLLNFENLVGKHKIWKH